MPPLFLYLSPDPIDLHSFPTRRSSDLPAIQTLITVGAIVFLSGRYVERMNGHEEDRKSTRLNSSHLGISYAVFCLKKKNRQTSGMFDQVGGSERGFILTRCNAKDSTVK